MVALLNRSSYIEGVFAPVTSEVTATELKVIGELPPELDGMFVQNSPNPYYAPEPPYHGLMAMGCSCRSDPRWSATYRISIQTEGLQREKAAGHPIWKALHPSMHH